MERPAVHLRDPRAVCEACHPARLDLPFGRPAAGVVEIIQCVVRERLRPGPRIRRVELEHRRRDAREFAPIRGRDLTGHAGQRSDNAQKRARLEEEEEE